MRLIHTIASVDPIYGGPSFSVPGLCAALARQGEQVELHSVKPGVPPASDPPYLARQYDQDFRGVPILAQLRLSSGLDRTLRKAVRESDLLHSHGVWLAPNLYPARAARAAGKPLVISPRGMLSEAAMAFSPQRKRLFWTLAQRRAVEAAACLHATSEAEYQDFRTLGLRAPVAVVPNGVEMPPEAEPAPSARTLLTLGRIHPKKGLDRLVRAWAQVERARPDWSLRIIGNDELGHAAELAALARELGAMRVSIERPVYGEAKTAAYRGAGLFVLPTLGENFAMTVAEALAHGVPAISTKGAPWAGLDTEGCGWWVEHGSESMARVLLMATALPDAGRAAMGARGRAWMARDFSWDSVALRMLSVYQWLIAGGEPPDTMRLG